MKTLKLLVVASAVALVAQVAHAQNFVRQSMMNNINIYLTNAATYVTNINDILAPGGVYTTNGAYITFTGTNLSSILVTNVATGTNYTTNSVVNVINIQAFKDVPFIENGANADGFMKAGATNSFIELGVGYSGANASNGVVLSFVPLLSGSEPGSASQAPFVEDTQTSWLVTNQTPGLLVTNGTWHFPINMGLYPGYWGLRVKAVFLGTASAAAQSQTVITNISLNGWRP